MCEGVPIVPLVPLEIQRYESDERGLKIGIPLNTVLMSSDNQQELFELLQREFSITLNDNALLTQAFTRRSHFNEPLREVTGTSEDMAFLGDAVLQAAVSQKLYTIGVKNIGVLTDRRKQFVSNKKIREIVGPYRLTHFLRSSQGEKIIADFNTKIIATTFEALVGAIFLNKGYDEVARFIREILMKGSH